MGFSQAHPQGLVSVADPLWFHFCEIFGSTSVHDKNSILTVV